MLGTVLWIYENNIISMIFMSEAFPCNLLSSLTHSGLWIVFSSPYKSRKLLSIQNSNICYDCKEMRIYLVLQFFTFSSLLSLLPFIFRFYTLYLLFCLFLSSFLYLFCCLCPYTGLCKQKQKTIKEKFSFFCNWKETSFKIVVYSYSELQHLLWL